MLLSKWTDQGVRNVKDLLPRTEQSRAAAEKLGARIIGVWWTQGSYDAVSVVEMPDDETASVGALALAMAGNVRTETMRAYTDEEMQRILQRLP